MPVADRAGRIALRFALALWVVGGVLSATAAEPEHSVAVLPFRVHSAKPVDYLGESLSNLIRRRLEVLG